MKKISTLLCLSLLSSSAAFSMANPLSKPAIDKVYQDQRENALTRKDFCSNLNAAAGKMKILMRAGERQLQELDKAEPSPTVDSWRSGISQKHHDLQNLSRTMQPVLQDCNKGWN